MSLSLAEFLAVMVPLGGGLLAILGWILKELYDLKADRGRDSERWKQNQADHERAFAEITDLREGQIEIKEMIGRLEHGKPH